MSNAPAATRWLPLESNPEVMNTFLWELGASREYSFVDIYGLDPELLAMVPQPAVAVLVLFPVSAATEAARKQEHERLSQQQQRVPAGTVFVKQTIDNACGTIALVHAACNNADALQFNEDGFFARFLGHAQRGATPFELADLLEADHSIGRAHAEAAATGQTAPPPLDADVDLHFVCFVVRDGHLLELDGRKAFPVDHGTFDSSNLLTGAAERVKELMSLDPSNLSFTMVALAKSEE